jgi:predicted dehydrogenase
VRRVHGRVVFSRPAFPELDDYARVTLTYDSGAVGGFEGGLSVPLGGGTTRAVLGTRAMALVEGRALRLRYLGDGAERLIDVPLLYDQETRVNAAVRAEDEEFVKAVEAGREPSVPGEAGRAALALCLAVHRSSREAQEITLEEAPGPPGAPGTTGTTGAQETPRS